MIATATGFGDWHVRPAHLCWDGPRRVCLGTVDLLIPALSATTTILQCDQVRERVERTADSRAKNLETVCLPRHRGPARA